MVSDQLSVVSGQLSVKFRLGGRGSCRAEGRRVSVTELVLGGPGGWGGLLAGGVEGCCCGVCLKSSVFFEGWGRAGMLGLHFCDLRQECSGWIFVSRDWNVRVILLVGCLAGFGCGWGAW